MNFYIKFKLYIIKDKYLQIPQVVKFKLLNHSTFVSFRF